MMHIQDTVISIVGQDKKSFREYDINKQDATRSCRVVLPFDTEYQFLVKNHGNRSICLKATIDGSDIFNEGLVVAPYATAYVERFLNSERKFKFVRKNNDQVSDPSNPSNGEIVITVEREADKPVFLNISPTWVPIMPVQQPQIHWTNQNIGNQNTYGGVFPTDLSTKRNLSPGVNLNETDYCSSTNWMCKEYSMDQGQVTSCNVSKNLEAGATVEGSKSNQSFTTVSFNGEGFVRSTFKFNLQGLSSSVDEAEYKKFLELKKKFEG